ncbi:MAG: hypothetical protein ACFFCV_13200 [Promethearchaeota archaeon]
MVERPEYVICPVCKEKINIDYNKTKHGLPTSNDLITMSLNTLHYWRVKTKESFIPTKIRICSHCKAVIGFQ